VVHELLHLPEKGPSRASQTRLVRAQGQLDGAPCGVGAIGKALHEARCGGVSLLARDVEALVLDPCFRDTDVQQWAEQLGCPLEWHHGFRLSVDELQRHPDYRGTQYIELGIASYAIDHGDIYPATGSISSTTLIDASGASYVAHWPTNPYLGVPMQDNTATGNYTYTQTNGGSGFMLVGHMNSNGFTVP